MHCSFFCFTIREGTPERRKSMFASRIYPFHHAPLAHGPPPPPRGGGLRLCIAHCYLYHPRGKKSNFMSRNNPSTATRSPSLYTREADPCAQLIVIFTIREILLNSKIRDSWRTKVRLPCVKGAGTANAVTEGLSLRKTNFPPSKEPSF